jgi:hypothetical protein
MTPGSTRAFHFVWKSGIKYPDPMPGDRSPSVHIVAGPNGAGKSTFARFFLPEYAECKEFVNADLIAAGLSPFNPESLSIEAFVFDPLTFERITAEVQPR